MWSESAVSTYKLPLCTCNSLLWSWDIKDENVKYVRYQVDSLSDDGWTTIEGATNEIQLPSHEGLNTLFVESSYDKENWSETSYGTYISKPYRTNKYEVSLRAYPYELQRISYIKDHTPIERFSSYGGGGGIELRYNISSLFSIGINTSLEYYNFEAFHTYLDFKAVATAGLRIIGSSESRNKVYFTLGGGIDFVLRNDREWGCYPLISYGVRDGISLTGNTSLSFGVDINHTFQNGTNVTHILPFLSFSYTWGCKAGCTNCEGGCR